MQLLQSMTKDNSTGLNVGNSASQKHAAPHTGLNVGNSASQKQAAPPHGVGTKGALYLNCVAGPWHTGEMFVIY